MQSADADLIPDSPANIRCRLLRPIRDARGRVHFEEHPSLVREVCNLERRMYLVRFADGTTAFLFPEEVVLE